MMATACNQVCFWLPTIEEVWHLVMKWPSHDRVDSNCHFNLFDWSTCISVNIPDILTIMWCFHSALDKRFPKSTQISFLFIGVVQVYSIWYPKDVTIDIHVMFVDYAKWARKNKLERVNDPVGIIIGKRFSKRYDIDIVIFKQS